MKWALNKSPITEYWLCLMSQNLLTKVSCTIVRYFWAEIVGFKSNLCPTHVEGNIWPGHFQLRPQSCRRRKPVLFIQYHCQENRHSCLTRKEGRIRSLWRRQFPFQPINGNAINGDPEIWPKNADFKFHGEWMRRPRGIRQKKRREPFYAD